jgi:hypothetical protein
VKLSFAHYSHELVVSVFIATEFYCMSTFLLGIIFYYPFVIYYGIILELYCFIYYSFTSINEVLWYKLNRVCFMLLAIPLYLTQYYLKDHQNIF